MPGPRAWVPGPTAAAASSPASSAAFFQALIEQTHDLVAVLDREGRYLYASPSHQTLLGYDPESLLGTDTFARVHPDDLDSLRERFRLAISRGERTASGLYRYRHENGTWHVLEAVATNLLDEPSVGGVVVTTRDVTERERAQEMLREQGRILADRFAELDLLYRTAPVGLGLIDRDLRYVRVNDRLAANNGLEPAQHVGRAVSEVIPSVASFLEPILRGVLDTGKPVLDLVVRGVAPGEPGVQGHWLISFHRVGGEDGEPVGVSCLVHDVTEQRRIERELKAARDELEARVAERTAALLAANEALRNEARERERAQESLRQSEERYRELVENVSDTIISVAADGRILYVSPAVERLIGRRPGEVIGRSFVEFLYPADLAETVASFERALEGRPKPSEYRVLAGDGTIRWVHSHSRPVVLEGQVSGIRAVLVDVTERHASEAAAQARREEVARVQRLSTAVATTAEIAHQINQPLAAIVSYAGGLAARLRNGSGEPKAMLEVARRIAHEAKRAGETIRRLRTLLRRGESAPVVFDLNRSITRVVAHIARDFQREEVRLDLHLDRGRAPICADPLLLEQVIENLLRNALDSMAGHGLEKQVCVTSSVADGMVRVQVEDTGAGLPSGCEDRIFEPFFTTKREALGLGLAVSRSIVEASGGRLWAENRAGSGTSVSLTLPAAASKRA